MANFNNQNVNAQTVDQGETFHQGGRESDKDVNSESFLLMSHVYRLAGEGRIGGRLADELCVLLRTGSDPAGPERRKSALLRAKKLTQDIGRLGPLIQPVEKLLSMAHRGP